KVDNGSQQQQSDHGRDRAFSSGSNGSDQERPAGWRPDYTPPKGHPALTSTIFSKNPNSGNNNASSAASAGRQFSNTGSNIFGSAYEIKKPSSALDAELERNRELQQELKETVHQNVHDSQSSQQQNEDLHHQMQALEALALKDEDPQVGLQSPLSATAPQKSPPTSIAELSEGEQQASRGAYERLRQRSQQSLDDYELELRRMDMTCQDHEQTISDLRGQVGLLKKTLNEIQQRERAQVAAFVELEEKVQQKTMATVTLRENMVYLKEQRDGYARENQGLHETIKQQEIQLHTTSIRLTAYEHKCRRTRSDHNIIELLKAKLQEETERRHQLSVELNHIQMSHNHPDYSPLEENDDVFSLFSEMAVSNSKCHSAGESTSNSLTLTNLDDDMDCEGCFVSPTKNRYGQTSDTDQPENPSRTLSHGLAILLSSRTVFTEALVLSKGPIEDTCSPMEDTLDDLTAINATESQCNQASGAVFNLAYLQSLVTPFTNSPLLTILSWMPSARLNRSMVRQLLIASFLIGLGSGVLIAISESKIDANYHGLPFNKVVLILDNATNVLVAARGRFQVYVHHGKGSLMKTTASLLGHSSDLWDDTFTVIT
ncbi:hypothetical protein BGW38_002526, partial [Lunasporangiospora selenospora]